MLILILLFFTSLILYYHFFHKLKRYPRGPTPIPLIGNTLTLKKYGGDIDKILIEWRRKFGDIYTIWIGETPLLMVNGYNKIMELFHNDDGRFSGRFKFGAKDDLLRGGKIAGVLHTENQLWQETRRFILRVFRDFGLGKDIMQERVLNEVSDLIAIINRDIEGGTKEHAMCEQIEARVGSVINSLLFGYRFDEVRNCDIYSKLTLF
jgi:cytochrome P450 family 33